MTTRDAKEIFLDALELEPGERLKFLRKACGEDRDLEARVHELLAAHGDADAMLGGVTASGLDSAPPLAHDLEPGDRVGPFVLEARIGEGGFGVVYRAAQEEPVQRLVALKVVKAGMGSRRVIARFETERQALAMMDHPGIARVFDAGTTDGGLPFFAMELVDGAPITHYCEEHRSSLRERLELFRSVCLALQHAHQRGVLHRDIKPSNVLVAEVDGKPGIKVIDFGIAKALEPADPETTILTREGHMIGTPAYMSPEQAEGQADVDTRTDVYSLGALLYELLSGEPPFTREIMRRAGQLEIQRILRDEDPAPPGSRVASREGDPTTTLARVPSELDWIVMRCLEKERARRYPTATSLAQDVERFLTDEPVEAAPPSVVYRMRKFARRHRTLSAVSIGVLAALLVGLVGTTLAMLSAERHAEAAERSALEAEAERANVLRLSAFQQLGSLRADARELWPPHPSRVDAYQEWLARARALLEQLPEHRRQLAELRERGNSSAERAPTEEEQALERHVAELALLGAAAEDATRDAEERLRALRAERAGSLAFDDAPTSWWYDRLAALVAELEALEDPDTGLVSGFDPDIGWGIERRLELALRLADESIASDEARESWGMGLAEIEDTYDGFVLEPQIGLLPLGPDPRSGLYEFAHLATGQAAVRGDDGELVIEGETGVVLVLIPGGDFAMGAQTHDPSASNYDPEALPNEFPVHGVALDPFFLSKYELTQGQWERLTNVNPSSYRPGLVTLPTGPTHPVESIGFDHCSEVLQRVGLSIPTEAQWEYATRARTATRWWTGDDETSLAGAADISDLRAARAGAGWSSHETWIDDGYAAHAPVGTFRANPFGLHDVHGNVWEWCRDTFAPYSGPTLAGSGERVAVPTDEKVARGGCFQSDAEQCRSSRRTLVNRLTRIDSLGVRPMRVIDR